MREVPELKKIAGVSIELATRGSGHPLLFLHPLDDLDPDAPVIKELARDHRVLVPTHPGFGTSELPRSFSTIDDLAYFYLDLMTELDLKDVVLVGVSIGGWIAAEIAIKSTARLSRLVLANTVGAKFGPPTTRDILDLFTLTPANLQNQFYADPGKHAHKFSEMSEDDVLRFTRVRESAAMYAWAPTLYNPKLRQRLHRIDVPTTLIWGEADKVVPVAYGRAFCAEIPRANLEVITGAGHYSHIERPLEFARAIRQKSLIAAQ